MKNQLEWYVRALAQPADIQKILFPDTGLAGDEMVLGFEESLEYLSLEGFLKKYDDSFTLLQKEALMSLNKVITEMSVMSNFNLWTSAGLDASEWEQVRIAAHNFLSEMQWSTLPPTSEGTTIIYIASESSS